MALCGNKDNINSQGLVVQQGRVTLNYATGIVTGSNLETPGAGALFGASGDIQEGDIISFGVREKPGTYFGSAVVVSIASTVQLTIGSTANLSGAAIASTDFQASQSPKSILFDSVYSEAQSLANGYSSHIYGISTTGSQNSVGTQYEICVGWVGVQTYIDSSGSLRVKKEILVAMSGIETGNAPIYPQVVDAN